MPACVSSRGAFEPVLQRKADRVPRTVNPSRAPAHEAEWLQEVSSKLDRLVKAGRVEVDADHRCEAPGVIPHGHCSSCGLGHSESLETADTEIPGAGAHVTTSKDALRLNAADEVVRPSLSEVVAGFCSQDAAVDVENCRDIYEYHKMYTKFIQCTRDEIGGSRYDPHMNPVGHLAAVRHGLAQLGLEDCLRQRMKALAECNEIPDVNELFDAADFILLQADNALTEFVYSRPCGRNLSEKGVPFEFGEAQRKAEDHYKLAMIKCYSEGWEVRPAKFTSVVVDADASLVTGGSSSKEGGSC
ncbi:hypothetical protein FB45DRAFT_998901 [Roridomyces roridus]|uniref:Uncharacterized protein n=1 Tax=Roridomyces roridus TaxID=1738132 RepID=A0AAD7G0S0_9AGAR|nr:hypothetical protein FB45DRAFT_998901 [Roridomyces roridus]